MMKTRKQIIARAKALYEHGKHPDIMVGDDVRDDDLLGDVIFTDDGKGAWVKSLVWVSLESPEKKRNGRKIK